MKLCPLLCATPLLLAQLIPVHAQPRSRAAAGSPLPEGAALPQWVAPTAPQLAPDAPSLRSHDIELVHSPDVLGAFVLRVGGKPVAIGQNQGMVGYLTNGQMRWFSLATPTGRKFQFHRERSELQVSLDCLDPDGGHWTFSHQFRPGPVAGTIDVVSQVQVDQNRQVAFLPMLMLFPGAGSFDSHKGQGLFAGLEYLDDEPSSSEADVIGPASHRQVPDILKITFPLMAIQNENAYVALTWQMRPHFCAVFDSPDRLFGSGAHVMGLLFPGSDGKNREEGNLLPRVTQALHAGESLVLHATLMGGTGRSLVPAVRQYVALRGLPLIPGSLDLPGYVTQTAGGWLDSKIRADSLFHHAVAGGNFPAGAAADAAMWMDWLAERSPDAAVATRLRETAQAAVAAVPAANLNFAAVGHVRYPVPALFFGHVAESAAQAQSAGQNLLRNFEPDGSMKYHPRPGGPDYAKTHSSNEANGYTSRAVLDLLEAAAFSGDQALLDAARQRLHAMDKFANGVPRGAQTWECPLHTPDILASAQMVRAYTLGYELFGEPAFLEQAQYWAWSGVPFVYLVNPTTGSVGLYGTIAVFGATQWKAPVWLGLPVQWCGLVYADALYRLVRDDPTGPWKKIADGITASGIQQSWPKGDADLQGLLPDSFVLRAQHRNGPAINPATVQACAVRLYGQPPVYDFWSFRKSDLRVHAPGEISHADEQPGRIRFAVSPGLNRDYFVLVNGLKRQPRLKINGADAEIAAPHQFEAGSGRLVLQLKSRSEIDLSL